MCVCVCVCVCVCNVCVCKVFPVHLTCALLRVCVCARGACGNLWTQGIVGLYYMAHTHTHIRTYRV